MSLTALPDGSQRFEKSSAHYSLTFPPGWTVDTSFPRHDLRATADGLELDGIARVDIFTQFISDLAGETAQGFLDNFGHADFDDMIRESYQAEFSVSPRGETPIRQRMIADRVWFVGDYELVGKTSGAAVLLRYAMAFERGTFYHLKGYLTGTDNAAGEAAFERLLESFSA